MVTLKIIRSILIFIAGVIISSEKLKEVFISSNTNANDFVIWIE